MAPASPMRSRRPAWVVVGGGTRSAGSPTAMLLARAGLRVLLADRADIASGSMRRNVIQQTEIDGLSRSVLLRRVAASDALRRGPSGRTGRPAIAPPRTMGTIIVSLMRTGAET